MAEILADNISLGVLLSNYRGNDLSTAVVAYQMISAAPEEKRGQMLMELTCRFREDGDETRKKSLPRIISEDDQFRLSVMNDLGGVQELDGLTEAGLSESQFYTKLWDYISKSPELEGQSSRIVALFQLLRSDKLPYFLLEDSEKLSMNDQTYRFYLGGIDAVDLARMEFILDGKGGLKQKTEQASALLGIMDRLDDPRVKTVFMAQIINYYTDIMNE